MTIKFIGVFLLLATNLPILTLADSGGHWYIAPQVTYIDLDHNRDDFTPKNQNDDTYYLGLGGGYHFNPDWALELSVVTDLNPDMSAQSFSIDGLRYFGDGWRPFVSAGISHFQLDNQYDDDTDQVQIGVGLSRFLSEKLETRIWVKHLYDVGAFSNNDNTVTLSLNYHFRELKKAAVSSVQPQPESVQKDEEVLETVELRVEFDTDKHFIRSVYQPQFDRVGAILKQNPEITFTIEGHADWRHTVQYNQALSERRANAVKQKLVRDYGINPARIATIGYGELRPIATNLTEEGMQRNRRSVAVFKRQVRKKP